jgi:hypothetical protein
MPLAPVTREHELGTTKRRPALFFVIPVVIDAMIRGAMEQESALERADEHRRGHAQRLYNAIVAQQPVHPFAGLITQLSTKVL